MRSEKNLTPVTIPRRMERSDVSLQRYVGMLTTAERQSSTKMPSIARFALSPSDHRLRNDGLQPLDGIFPTWQRLEYRSSYCRWQWRVGRCECIRLILPLAVTSDVPFSHSIRLHLRLFL